jgi:NhaP-type Na+/H+ or K+/H+ antiporter
LPACELTAELLKLAALLLFGALLSPSFIADFAVGDYVFVVAAIVLARPAALLVALAGSRLTRREWMAAAWFGPRGFASVVYALLVLHAGLASGEEIFHLAGVAVALSIVAHSSTDVLVARSFERAEAESPAEGLLAETPEGDAAEGDGGASGGEASGGAPGDDSDDSTDPGAPVDRVRRA